MSLYQNVLPDRIIGANANKRPGRGWTAVTDFPTLITNARLANLPLLLLPGTYRSLQIDITSATGNGNPLVLNAVQGGVSVELAGIAPYLLSVNGVAGVNIQNITFNGNHIQLTDTSQTGALINISGHTRTIHIQNCTVCNTTETGICCYSSANGNILDNIIYSCNIGIFCIEAVFRIARNNVTHCSNNGILVWTNTNKPNYSVVDENFISDISNTRGGSGQNGNGINILRAAGVKVTDNIIYSCGFSAVRLNSAGNCQVVGNYCSGMGENAIWFEAPGSGGETIGGLCANNIIINAASGIACVNEGQFNDGVARKITIIGNQISFVTYQGIIVEGTCNVVGNIIENAGANAIVLGTNNVAANLTAVGNIISKCAMGIGYSANDGALGILISGNLIDGYVHDSDPESSTYALSGAIVSVSRLGASGPLYARDAPGGRVNVDYGNALQTQIGSLTVGMNQST